ncbi:hypothetical protein Tco_0987280 [Tanacetum coccineum]
MVCSFVAKSKSNGVDFDGGLFFVTAIGDEPGITIYGSDLLLLSAYAPSMPPLFSLPLSMARDDSDGNDTKSVPGVLVFSRVFKYTVLYFDVRNDNKILGVHLVVVFKRNEYAADTPKQYFSELKEKIENDMMLLGKKIKQHEENINYFKTHKNTLDDAVSDMQGVLFILLNHLQLVSLSTSFKFYDCNVAYNEKPSMFRGSAITCRSLIQMNENLKGRSESSAI